MKLRHISYQGAGLLARKGFIALSFIAIARVLGPQVFGEFSYVYTWVYMCALISSLGFSPVSTREIARNSTSAASVLNSTLLVRVTASFLAILILLSIFWLTPLGKPGVRGLVLILGLGIPPMAIADQLSAYVMGFNLNSKFALVNLVQWGIYFLATWIGLAFWHNITLTLTAQCVGLWVSVAICIWLFWDHIVAALLCRPDWSLLAFLVREAAPLALTNLLGILYFRIGTLQLFTFSGAQETGLYTSALQVLEGLQLIPMAVTGAMFPAICRAVFDPKQFSDLFQKITSLLLFTSLFIGATGSVISGSIVTLLFGSKFAGSGHLLATLIWACIPTFLHFTFAYFLIAANMQRAVTVNAVAGVFVSIVSNSLLIPHYGALGAVYGSVITETCICLLHLAFLWRRVDIKKKSTLLVPLSGTLFVFALGVVWGSSINTNLAALVLFCFIALVLFGTTYAIYYRLQGESTFT